MIDVYGTGEFNVPDDTNKLVVVIPQCVISQSMCELLASRAFKFQTFDQLIIKYDVNHCNYKIRVRDTSNPTERRVSIKS